MNHSKEAFDLDSIWIEEEKTRKSQSKKSQWTLDSDELHSIRELIDKDGSDPKNIDNLVAGIFDKADSQVPTVDPPLANDLDQRIMIFQRSLAKDEYLISNDGFGIREDIFTPELAGEAEANFTLLDHKSNFRERNISVGETSTLGAIRGKAKSQHGGHSIYSAPYWRFRIYVGNFDATRLPYRFLCIDPCVSATGRVMLMAFSRYIRNPNAGVYLRFWSGTRHWRFNGAGYDPTWSGWRRSRDVINKEIISFDVVSQQISLSCPQTIIETPAYFDRPGSSSSPHVNGYGRVEPYDIIDFYVAAQISAITKGVPTIAEIEFTTLHVPYISYKLSERAPL